MGKTRRTWKKAACDQELAVWEILDREEALDSPTAFGPANEDEAWSFIKVRELIDTRYFLGARLQSIPKTPGYYAGSALFDDWRSLDQLGDITNNDILCKTLVRRDGQKSALSIYHSTFSAARKYHRCIVEYQKQSYTRRLVCSKRPLSP
jgi:hypothetical protein